MFSRNRSAQLLELPLLSRFAADLRPHTRAFAYKLPHKIHNTSPRRAIPTEDIHRSREFRQNRGGDSPADRRISKQNPSSSHRLAPFPSHASGEHREAFALVPETCAVFALSPAHRSPSPSGTQQKASEITHEQAKEKLPLGFIGDAAPMWVGRRPMLRPIFPLAPTKKGMSERKTTNAPTKLRRKKRRKRLKKKECRGASSLFVRRNEENRGLLPNKWRLSVQNPRLLSVEVGETRSRLAVRRRMCNFATT